MNAEQTFRQKAPWLMRRLIADFSISILDAAAIAGNAGHESGGLIKLQEIRPTVKGSRGGYGWFQWTGPRRKAFETFCVKQKLSISSDEANYQFLAYELKTSEKAAIPAVKKAKDLPAKVIAFEQAFERAGVKHYDSRVRWAEIALEAHKRESVAPAPVPPPVVVPPPAPTPIPPPPDVEPLPVPPPAVTEIPGSSGKNIAAIVLAFAGAVVAALAAWIMKG